jgi:hypothetical protein
MKKYMISDFKKELEIQEDKSFTISIGEVEAEWDKTNDNYVVTIFFNRGGSAEYIMSPDDLDDFMANPSGTFYNANIRLS